MYVSGRTNNQRRQNNSNYRENERERFIIPSEYDGNALRDPEALARAEEAFRRGYVFEDTGAESSEPDAKAGGEAENESNEDGIHTIEITEKEDVISGDPANEKNEENAENNEPSVTASAVPLRENVSGDGAVRGILRGITTEHIILVAAILILWDSRADDELMIMLAILLFC